MFPGQMLYIPAGWFHEVRSRGSYQRLDASGNGGGHLALNYWFHPPDGERHDKPYLSDFWSRDMQLRKTSGSAL